MPRRASKKVLALLNNLYNAEIGAIGVYMDQSFKAKDAGLNKLADIFEGDAKDEMKHAERIAGRILELGGGMKYEKHIVPEADQSEVVDFLITDIRLEVEALATLNKGIKVCFDEGDNQSRMLLEDILKEEESHLTDYEVMLDNVEKYGNTYIVEHLM